MRVKFNEKTKEYVLVSENSFDDSEMNSTAMMMGEPSVDLRMPGSEMIPYDVFDKAIENQNKPQ